MYLLEVLNKNSCLLAEETNKLEITCLREANLTNVLTDKHEYYCNDTSFIAYDSSCNCYKLHTGMIDYQSVIQRDLSQNKAIIVYSQDNQAIKIFYAKNSIKLSSNVNGVMTFYLDDVLLLYLYNLNYTIIK